MGGTGALPHPWEPDGPTGDGIPVPVAPSLGAQDPLPLSAQRDPPMVFVLIFLNKRCYPRLPVSLSLLRFTQWGLVLGVREQTDHCQQHRTCDFLGSTGISEG